MLAIELSFHAGTTISDIRATLTRLKRAIQAEYPRVRRIYLDSAAIEN